MDIAAGTRATLVADIQGSIVASLDSGSGTMTRWGYRPFGENPALSTDSFAYTAQRHDPETSGGSAEPSGLYYDRARMYSPTLGRFLQPDPAGGGATNLYAYVGNDPLNQIDPSGMKAEELIQAGSSFNCGFAGTCLNHELADQSFTASPGWADFGGWMGDTASAVGETANQGINLASVTPSPIEPEARGIRTVRDAVQYIYRGVHADHPELEFALNGIVKPGKTDGTLTAEQHNSGLYNLADSPFSSWTHDLDIAQNYANSRGPGGVVLQVPVGRPPPGASWSWEYSPDVFSEKEVLLRGVRTNVTVRGQ
jgi:RHS repeat-associated protein